MKINTSILALGLLLTSGAEARMTAKQKTLTWSFGGCGVGLAVGFGLAERDNENDRAATIGTNTAIGCALGLISSWLWVKDDQASLAKERDHALAQLDELKRATASSVYRTSDKAKFGDFLSMTENYQGSNALNKLVSKDCVAHRFYLGFDGRELTDVYIPVSEDIIIKSLEYYVIRPKNLNDKEVVCVEPIQPFGYLSLELQGIDNILFKHAKTTLEKMELQK